LEHGKRIQAAIMEAGFGSLSDFAVALGCSRALVYRYANGTTLARIDVMQRIAHLTGKPLPYFYSEGDDDAAAPTTSAGGPRRLEDPKTLSSRADHLLSLGTALTSPPDHARAAMTYMQLVTLAEQLEDKVLEARAHFRAGNCHLQLGAFADATRCFRRALDLFAEAGEETGVRACRQSLVCSLQSIGEFDAALEHARELTVSRDARKRWIAGLSVAAILEQVGKLQEAWAQLDSAEEEASQAANGDPGPFEQTYIQANRANVAIARGRYRSGARYARRAAEAAREAGLHDQTLEADLTYGLCLLRMGEPGMAFGHLDRSLRLADLAGDKARMAAAHACECEWYTVAGRFDEARESGRAGYDLASKGHGAMPELFAGLALARAHLESELLSDAESYARGALHLASRIGAPLYAAWAKLIQAEVNCWREDGGPRALQLADSARGVARPSTANHLLAEALRVSALAEAACGDRVNALRHAREAIGLAEETGVPWTTLRARIALARAVSDEEERGQVLEQVHANILEQADKFARHNLGANLLRVPDLFWAFRERAVREGMGPDDRTLHQWRSADAATLSTLLPAPSGAGGSAPA